MAEWLSRLTRNQFSSEAQVQILLTSRQRCHPHIVKYDYCEIIYLKTFSCKEVELVRFQVGAKNILIKPPWCNGSTQIGNSIGRILFVKNNNGGSNPSQSH